MGEFSLSHLLILAVILLVFFGPSRLPGLGKSIGEAIRGFKKGMEEEPPGNAAAKEQIRSSPDAEREKFKSEEKEKI